MFRDLDVVLVNVLADALAHHEASGAPSLVRHSDPDGDDHWLDFERAGAIAAAALELVGVDVLGRNLFAVPVGTTAGTVAAVDASETSTVALSQDDPNLVARVLATAREVFPVPARRGSWLVTEMRRYRPEATFAELQRLDAAELLALLERLEAYRNANRLGGLAPGVHKPEATS